MLVLKIECFGDICACQRGHKITLALRLGHARVFIELTKHLTACPLVPYRHE